MSQRKGRNYVITYSQPSYERHILVMLRTVGKYLYDSADRLLKEKPEKVKWSYKPRKGAK